MLTATVSGSFHRHMTAIYTAVGELTAKGVKVLSPSDPRVVDHLGEFLFVASDRLRSVRLVQDRHLHCIAASSFLWLVTPDGYVGPSASLEIGFATAARVPVFSDTLPSDVTIREYVTKVAHLDACVQAARLAKVDRAPTAHFLIDPAQSVEILHATLDQLSPEFTRLNLHHSDRARTELASARRIAAATFGLTPDPFDV
ncbi:MAG: hypothetical protein ACREJ5_12525 [Geminicoccaceae bacterium]